MPGPISDSYDPEWGTAENASRIEKALVEVYARVSCVLWEKSALPIDQLIGLTLPRAIPATLTERDWRLIRFALERAIRSI